MRWRRLLWLTVPVWWMIGIVGFVLNEKRRDVGWDLVSPPIRQIWQRKDKQGAVTLWFDDAWSSQYSVGFKEMQRRKWPGVLGVATSMIGGKNYMTWDQVRDMRRAGWEIAAHTRSHFCDRDVLVPEVLDEEIIGSKQDLRFHGIEVRDFVTPCGVVVPGMEDLVRKTFRSLRTSDPGLEDIPPSFPYELKTVVVKKNTNVGELAQWIESAKKQGKWLNLAWHQIGSENKEYEFEETRFVEVLVLIEKSGLPVVAPGEVLRY